MVRSLVRFLGIALGWVLLAAAATAIWLHYHSARGTTAIYVTAGVPLMLVVAVAAVVLFLLFRRWMALCLAVAALIGLGYTQAPLWVSQNVSAGERFTVVSANLMVGSGDIDALAAQVESVDASLVSLQEVTPAALERIRASTLVRRLPYQYVITGDAAGGTMLLSTSPLADQQRIPNSLLNNLSARTALPGASSTTVLGVHIAAPLTGYADDWNRELAGLRERLAALPAGPVVVAGDFNATWDHAQYRALLDDGFADAAAQAGAGFVPTYPTDRFGGRPLAAIDHVIVRGFTSANFYTFDLEGSDHRGVVVSLVAS